MLQLLGGGAVSAGRAAPRWTAWAIAAAGLAGCAAPARSNLVTAAAPSETAGGDPHAQIEALDRQISEQLARGELTPPAPAACVGAACAEAVSAPFSTAPIGGPTCRPAGSERCTSACTLATSICDNQHKICELARALPGDDWAANKCERARTSCRAAHDACCGCA